MNARTPKNRPFAFLLSMFLAFELCLPGACLPALAEAMEVAPEVPMDTRTVDEVDGTVDGPADDGATDGPADGTDGPAPVDDQVDQADPDPQGLPDDPVPVDEPVAAASEGLPEPRDIGDGFTDYGGLSIAGGTPGTSYALENVTYSRIGRGSNETPQHQDGRQFPVTTTDTRAIAMLVIKADGAYTVRTTAGSGTAVATGIRVAPGVDATITFAGVNIQGQFPMDIATNSTASGNGTVEVSGDDVADKTTVHLILADGTTNTLHNSYYSTLDTGSNTPAAYMFPGLRCGEGSVLVVDDEVLNQDVSGEPVVPAQGMIPAGTTYVDRDGKTQTSTGVGKDLVSSLSNLESRDPGQLWVYSGIRSAAIGGGPIENSGDMTFNGGDLHVYSNDKAANGSGAAIGGGHAGGGTTITFNGGTVDSYASFHGAAIGGGCTYTGGMSSSTSTWPLRDAIISRTANHTIAGDITVNGGFVEAWGAEHSNAFGQGCGGTNTGRTILITGGTLLPHWGGNGGFLEIGGSQGYVVITGGSVNCTRFQGNDNDGLAYGDLERTKKVAMLTIDVKSKIQAMADAAGVTPDFNAKLESWELLLDKMLTDPPYGAPANLNDGKLYLWLPKGTNTSHQIDANFSYYVGEKLLTSNTTLPQGSAGSGDTTAKEWESFKLDEDFVTKNWSKYYDGEPLEKVDVSKTPIKVDNPAGGQLDNNDKIKYNYQQMDEDGNPISAATTGTRTPADAGFYDIEVRSEQYKENAPFSQTYWGHSATGRAVISPVCSTTSWELSEPVVLSTTDADGNEVRKEYTAPTWAQDDNAGNYNTATNNHLVVPVDVTSGSLPFGDSYPDGSTMSRTSCKAPTGRLQLYIDDRAVPEGLGGVIEVDRDRLEDASFTHAWIAADDSGREHTMAYFDLTRSQLEAFGLEDKSSEGNEHHVRVEYTSASADAGPRDEAAAASEDDSEPWVPAHNDSAYVNYYESANDDNAVEIELATPDLRLFNESGTGYIPNGEGLAEGDLAANDAKLKLDEDHERDWTAPDGTRMGTEDHTDVSAFRDKLDDAGNVVKENPDWFPLYLQTNSIGDVEFTSSNPAVISVVPNDAMTDRTYVENKTDYGVGARARVLSAGKTTITATVKGTGAYSGASRSFDVYVFPDLAKKPELTLTATAYDTTRDDGTVRPGDVMRYTVTATNTAADSACINPVYELGIPGDTTLKSLVAVAPDGTETVIENPRAVDGKVVVDSLPTLFGGQSWRFVLNVTVDSDLFDPGHGALELASTSKASGIYGVNPDQFEWDTRFPAEGMPVDDALVTVDPSKPAPDEPGEPEPDPDKAVDILGGDLIDETPDPDDPDDEPDAPGVPVGPVVPGSPFDEAELPDDPDDPDAPPVREPIQPGDRVVIFGDDPDPVTPEDIAKELEEQIRKKLEEDPEATEVKIPVTVERPGPDGTPERVEVVVTVPITPDMRPEPEDRDDHDLVPVPSDVDPRPDGDIVSTKKAVNVTPGHDRRPNKSVALVGDTIRYTVTVSNTLPGGAWYNVVVRDALPVGLAYVPGSARVTLADGTELTEFSSDFDPATRVLGFCLGDLVSVSSASVTFDCTVTPDALTVDVEGNVATPFGTEPSATVTPDPENPDGPPSVGPEPETPGPWNPEDHDKTWEDVEKETEEQVRDGLPVPDDEEVKVAPTDPSFIDDVVHEVVPGDPDHSRFSCTKTAENLSGREAGTVLVGDTIRYTVAFTNGDEPWTRWYDVTLYDKMPAGVTPVSGSFRLVLPDGVEMSCPDSVYNPVSGDVSVAVGAIDGGQTVTLVFDALVEEAAVGTDIANTASALGTDPSGATEGVIRDGGSAPIGDRREVGGLLGIYGSLDASTAASSEVAYPDGVRPEVSRPAPGATLPQTGSPIRATLSQRLRAIVPVTGDQAATYGWALLAALACAGAVTVVEGRRRGR